MIINENGLIINDASKDKVQQEYVVIIDRVRDEIYRKLSNIKSFYVTGSVSSGTAKAYTSDIDFVVIMSNELKSDELEWVQNLSEELEKEFLFVTDIDIAVVFYGDILEQKVPRQLIVNLRTSGLLIFGENINNHLPEFYTGLKMARYLYLDFEVEIGKLKEKLNLKSDFYYCGRKKSIQFLCRWTMRRIVRSTCALIMLEKRFYSPELIRCYEEFNKIYPELGKYIQQAIKWELNPIDDREAILTFLDDFLPVYLALFREKGIIAYK